MQNYEFRIVNYCSREECVVSLVTPDGEFGGVRLDPR